MIKNGGRLLRGRGRTSCSNLILDLESSSANGHSQDSISSLPSFLLPAWHDNLSFPSSSIATTAIPATRQSDEQSTSSRRKHIASRRQHQTRHSQLSSSSQCSSFLHRRSSSSLAIPTITTGSSEEDHHFQNWYYPPSSSDSMNTHENHSSETVASTSKLPAFVKETLPLATQMDKDENGKVHQSPDKSVDIDQEHTTISTATANDSYTYSNHVIRPSVLGNSPTISVQTTNGIQVQKHIDQQGSVQMALLKAKQYLKDEKMSNTFHRNDYLSASKQYSLLPLRVLPMELLHSLLHRTGNDYTTQKPLDDEESLLASHRLHLRLSYASNLMQALMMIKQDQDRPQSLSRQQSRHHVQAALSELLCWDSKTFSRTIRNFASRATHQRHSDIVHNQELTSQLLLLMTISQGLHLHKQHSSTDVTLQAVLGKQPALIADVRHDQKSRRLLQDWLKVTMRSMETGLHDAARSDWLMVLLDIIRVLPVEDASTAGRALQAMKLRLRSFPVKKHGLQERDVALASFAIYKDAFDCITIAARHAIDFVNKGRRSDRRDYLRQLDLQVLASWRALWSRIRLSTSPAEVASLDKRLLQIHNLALQGGLVLFASNMVLDNHDAYCEGLTAKKLQDQSAIFADFTIWKDTIRQCIRFEELQAAHNLLERVDTIFRNVEEASTIMHFRLQIALRQCLIKAPGSLEDLHKLLQDAQARKIPLDHHSCTTLLRGIPKLDLPMDERCDLFNAVLELVEGLPNEPQVAGQDELNARLAAVISDVHLFEQAKLSGVQLPWRPLATAEHSSHHAEIYDSQDVTNIRNRAGAISTYLRMAILNGNFQEASAHYVELLEIFSYVSSSMRCEDIQVTTSHIGRIYNYLREVWLASFIKILSLSLKTQSVDTSVQLLRNTLVLLGPRFVGYKPVRRVLLAACSSRLQETSRSDKTSSFTAPHVSWPLLSQALHIAVDWAHRIQKHDEAHIVSEIDIELTTAGRLRELRGSRSLRHTLLPAAASGLVFHYLSPDQAENVDDGIQEFAEAVSYLARSLETLGVDVIASLEEFDTMIVAQLTTAGWAPNTQEQCSAAIQAVKKTYTAVADTAKLQKAPQHT